MADVNEPQDQDDFSFENRLPDDAGAEMEHGEALDDAQQAQNDNNSAVRRHELSQLHARHKEHFKAIRAQQGTIVQRDKSQGQTVALGYHQINPADKTDFRFLQEQFFGFHVGFDYFDEETQRKKRDLEEYYQACYDRGAPVDDRKKSEYTVFEDKLFNGYRLDKSLVGSKYVLSYRLADADGRMQQIFDDGTAVRACANGGFNATTAMGMAAAFWSSRALPDMGFMKVDINTRKTIAGAFGGVKADYKASAMLIANLHMAHRFGIQHNIAVNGMDADNFREANEENLMKALEDYNNRLRAIGELPNGQNYTLDDLFAQPESRLETDHDMDNADEMALSGEAYDADGLVPTSAIDGDTPPENDGVGSALVADTAPDAETPANEADIIGADEEIDANAPQALSHDPSLDRAKSAEADAPAFKTQRDPNAVVASEPRQSHGNDVPAQSKWVQGMISAEKAKTADAALGGQDKNLPAAPASTAVINPTQKADDAAAPKPTDRRIQGPTGTPGM